MAGLRKRMSASELQERRAEKLEAIKTTGDQLVDKWAKSKAVLGEDVVGTSKGNISRLLEVHNSNPNKARNWATLLENTKQHMNEHLSETQTAQTISGVTPNHVMKVISYAYPNSVRSDIFHEWAMATTKDSYYFLTREYGKTKRGAVEGNTIIASADAGRASSEIEILNPDETVDGSTKVFTKTLAPQTLVPKKVLVFVDGIPVAYDDGAGALVGITSTQADKAVVSGTVDYTTGAFSITFADFITAGLVIDIQFNYDSEDVDNYDEAMTVKLGLSETRFEPRPHNVNVEWSQLLQWKFGSTLDVNAETQFISAAGDELKAGADRTALSLGYKYAKMFPKTEYEASFGQAGADDAGVYANTFTRALKSVEKTMYSTLNKGGVSVAYAGADIVGFLEQSSKWVPNLNPFRIGAYFAGTFNGVPVYQAENVVGMPEDEMVVIYKNQTDPDDAFLSFGVFLPMVLTPKLQYKNFNNEIGTSSVYASEKINDYARIIKFNNLDI